MCGPLIDWNGNGQIDPSDIAITLAAAEEEEMGDEDDEDEGEERPITCGTVKLPERSGKKAKSWRALRLD